MGLIISSWWRGKSGVDFLGDKGHFVTFRQETDSRLRRSGPDRRAISFAKGENARTLFGYSHPAVSAVAGSLDEIAWDPASQLFVIKVHASSNGAAHLNITESFSRAPLGTSGQICGADCGTGSAVRCRW
jgi:hypothetical protein